MDKFIIKEAKTDHEIFQAKQIRLEVFVNEQNISLEAEEDGLDAKSVHLLAFQNEVAVATGRLTPESNTNAVISRIAVRKNSRGFGFGKQIVKALEKIAIEKGIQMVYLDPHAYLEEFYQNLGYKKIPDWQKVVGGHQLIRMIKYL